MRPLRKMGKPEGEKGGRAAKKYGSEAPPPGAGRRDGKGKGETMEKKRGRPRKVSPADREMLIGQFQDACLPVFLVDRKLEVLYTNRYAQESFLAMGLPNGLLAVLPADSVEECIRRMGEGESFRIDLPLARTTRISLAFSPIREKDGELTGALVLGTFTEDRELSGLEIAAAGGAAALSRALRQPLYEIFGTLSTMGRRMLANGDLVDEDKEYKKYIESINGAAYQILRNSDNLTAYLGACSDYHPEKEVVNFWSRMAELLDACAIALHNNATPFSFQLPRSDVRVRCRFREMEEALMNLISNAYGSARSQNQVVVIGRGTPEGVVVEVSDHGRGILPEEQEKVFSPFYSKGEKGEAFAGMGLGMTVARQKICGNGGTIVMNSVPGEGTTVAFTLPVCEEPLTPRLAMESGSAPYLQSRYSSVYVGLCSQATLPPQY